MLFPEQVTFAPAECSRVSPGVKNIVAVVLSMVGYGPRLAIVVAATCVNVDGTTQVVSGDITESHSRASRLYARS